VTLEKSIAFPKQTKEIVIGLGIVCLVVLSLIWCYWATIIDLVREWRRSEDYSVGQLVPFVALYLAWNDREKFRKCRISPSGWGIAMLVLALGLRLYGLLFLYQSVERYSIILAVGGLVLLIAGWDVFARAKWILLFLVLMIPPPGRIHNAITGPLQSQATAGAVFFLELFGVSVIREGNVILLNDSVPLAVAEACSGLRMLTAFIVVAATFACVVQRPLWHKAVLLLSSIPIAIFCNLIRLWATAEIYLVTQSITVEKFFHNFAGLTMMPVAVLILVGELIVMEKIVIPESPPGKRIVFRRNTNRQNNSEPHHA